MILELSPEDEDLVAEKLSSGVFVSIEDLIHHALVLLPTPKPATSARRQNFADFLLESPLRGSGLSLDREEQYPRPAKL